MSEFKRFKDNITKKCLVVMVVILALCLVLKRDDLSVFLGLLYGCAFSILKFRLAADALQKFAALSGKSAVSYHIRDHFLRYGLTAAVIVVAVFSPQLNSFAVIGGIFLSNVVVVCDQIIGGLSGAHGGTT